MHQIEVVYYINDEGGTAYVQKVTLKCKNLRDLKKQVRDIERAWAKDKSVYWMQTEDIEWADKIYRYNGRGDWTVESTLLEELKEKAKAPGKKSIYWVMWPGTDDEGSYIKARNPSHAELIYFNRVSNYGEDEDMLFCWAQIRKDLSIKKIKIQK
jgi:hypothetical protein